MHPLLILSIVVQVLLISHAIRHDHGWGWVLLILVAPLVGAVVYGLVVLLPEWNRSLTAQRAARRVRETLDPDRELRARRDNLDGANTVDHKLRLADELVRRGDPAQAIALYEECLSGPFAGDPDIRLLLATAQFAAGRAADTRATLERLIADHPDFRSQPGHLLYARALEQLGAADQARHEYEALVAYATGPEARCRYAQFLAAQGEGAAARTQFDQVLADARRAPAHYRKLHREWIELAEREAGG